MAVKGAVFFNLPFSLNFCTTKFWYVWPGDGVKKPILSRFIAIYVITTLNVIGCINYNIKCDWLIELSDNNLAK